MRTPPPALRAPVRRPIVTPIREPLGHHTVWDGDLEGASVRTVTTRPTSQHRMANRFRPAPPGTPCCLAKCHWPADHLVTFHQTGGTVAYCDDHGWPFKPRRSFR